MRFATLKKVCEVIAVVIPWCLLGWWFLLSYVRRRCEEDDEGFLRSRVPFLSREKLLALGRGVPLGCGGFGYVRKVVYRGKEVAVKFLFDEESVAPLLREARMMVEANGAGGVPALLAVCLRPPVLVQEFVEDTYADFLEQCRVGEFLDSLVAIARLLEEIHAKDIAHNDVRPVNVTFTGSVHEPAFHLIDLGLSCHFGQVAAELMKDVLAEARELRCSLPSRHHHEDCSFCSDLDHDAAAEKISLLFNSLAPEVLMQKPSYASADVFSFGAMVSLVLVHCEHHPALRPLWRVVNMCIQLNPRRRCLLTCVTRTIAKLKARLSPDQLHLFLMEPQHRSGGEG